MSPPSPSRRRARRRPRSASTSSGVVSQEHMRRTSPVPRPRCRSTSRGAAARSRPAAGSRRRRWPARAGSAARRAPPSRRVGEPARPSRWRARRCAATGRPRAARRTARRGSAPSRRAAASACAGTAKPSACAGSQKTTASPISSPFFVAAEGDRVDADVGRDLAQRDVQAGGGVGQPRAVDVQQQPALVGEVRERAQLVRAVARAELRALRDADDARLDGVLVAEPAELPLDVLGRELRVVRLDGLQLDARQRLGRAALVDVDVRLRGADDRLPRPAQRAKAQHVGGAAVEDEVATRPARRSARAAAPRRARSTDRRRRPWRGRRWPRPARRAPRGALPRCCPTQSPSPRLHSRGQGGRRRVTSLARPRAVAAR